MIAAVIEASVRHRGIVATLALLLAVLGVAAWRALPVDAIPDLSDTQVIVVADHPGQSPEVVDQQVTWPLSSALLAVPRAETVRGFSFFGVSMVYVLFDDGTDPYWARARVSETLDAATARLPEDVRPRLGPDATGVGWVYQYVLLDAPEHARALRAALDADGDGEVSPDEQPPPQVATEVGRQEICTHTLLGLCVRSTLEGGQALATYDPARLQGWLGDDLDLDTLLAAFDRSGDDRLDGPELASALAFRGLDLARLRTLQDDYLRDDLASLQGVAEIASVGGFERQIQVEVDPERLRAFDLDLADVRRAVSRSQGATGGRVLELAETEHMVRAEDWITDPRDLLHAPLGLDPETHTALRLGQVARVVEGPASRRGLTDWNGRGDVVSGIVVQRTDADARAVIARVRDRLAVLSQGLPPGVHLATAYDRAPLIDRATRSLTDKLLAELALVALVLGLFLLHLRSTLVPLVTLPLAVGATFVGMAALGLRADIMSLGGIAIALGVMVDAAVVLVENVHKRAEKVPDEPAEARVIAACREVGPAIFTSLLLVTVSFVPVFALSDAEGRLFGPLAWTKTLSMAAAAVLAITVVPALLVPVARGRFRAEADHPVTRVLIRTYRPLLTWALGRPRTVLLGAAVLSATALWPLGRLGTEFMPPLAEGDLLYMPTTPPGLSITRARELLQQTDRLIAAHPQVDTVLGKAGRAQTATDPAPLSMFETVVQLTDRSTWPPGKRTEDVVAELDRLVQVPGLTNAWTQPIRARLDMLSTGIRTDVGIKLLGDDLDVLARLAERIEAEVSTLPGTGSVYGERVTGGHYVDVSVDRAGAARYGLDVAAVHDVVRTAVGGAVVARTIQGPSTVDVVVRFPPERRHDLDALRRLPLRSPLGHTVPLGQVATVSLASGPPGIKREDARRTSWVFVDLTTSDLGRWVDRAQRHLAQTVALPPGVTLAWSGQFQSLQRARSRLAWIVPATFVLILLLLQVHFRRVAPAVMVLAGTILFAPLGGLWAIWLAGHAVSVATIVGFLALAGLAAETGVVMWVYLDAALAEARAAGPLDPHRLEEAAMAGAVDRVRPKIMTVATTLLGLVPILLGHEAGAAITQRIAWPMVGGLASSALLTLIVLPVAWLLWRRRELASAAR